MKYKSENNIAKLQKGNRLALFQQAVNAVQNQDEEALQKINEQATALEQDDRRIAYNQLHGLPQETRFVPSNGGEIIQGPDKLYKNDYDRWTTNTAKGQEFKRFVNGPLKVGLAASTIPMFASEIATYGLLGGGLRIGGGLTTGAIGSKALGTVGDYADKKLNTGFLGSIGRFVGGLGGYGIGSRLGYGAAKNILAKQIGKYGAENIPQWYAPDNIRLDLVKDAVNVGFPNATATKPNPLQIEQYPEVSVVNAQKPWRTDPNKINDTQRFYIKGQEDRGYFELVKDLEPGNYSVHFKPTDAKNPNAFTETEKRALFKAVADAVPKDGNLSTWGSVSRGGLAGVNRFENLGFKQTGVRPLVMKETGESVNVPIFTKLKSAYQRPSMSKQSVVLENDILSSADKRAPQIWNEKDDFLNSELFQNSSQNTKNEFFKHLKELINPNTSKVKIRIQDQPNANEIEGVLSSVLENRKNEYLPFSIIRLNDGTFKRLPGNLEEITRSYYGIDNGLINPNEGLITRAHDIDLQEGFKKSGMLFYGGQGDEGLVLPYAYSKKRTLGDLRVRDPKKYEDYYKSYKGRKDKIENLIQNAFNAGDLKSAAKYYAERMSIPELDKPYLLDRLTRTVPFTEITTATESVPSNRWREALQMLTAGIDKSNNTILPLFNQYRKVDFENPRMSIFSGNPENMERVIGGYYINPNAVYKKPDLSLKKWSYSEQDKLAQDLIKKELLKYNIEPTKGMITTNILGKMFNNNGSIVGIPVADFHHPNIKGDWQLPKLIMIAPENSKYLYRVDQHRLGLKQGGTIKAQLGLSNLPVHPQVVNTTINNIRNSKFGKITRNILNGKDMDLSDEEYLSKYGYGKPVGSLGVLGAVVAPEWSGLNAPITAEHIPFKATIESAPKIKYAKLESVVKNPRTKQLSNFQKFLKKSVQEQDNIVKYWNGENFNSYEQLKRNPKQYEIFKKWYNKQK